MIIRAGKENHFEDYTQYIYFLDMLSYLVLPNLSNCDFQFKRSREMEIYFPDMLS